MASRVGDDINAENSNWSFAGQTVPAFDAHVRKSVPLYTEGQQMVEQISDFFITQGSVCYELGCSTGALSLRLAERHQKKDARFVGIDCEADMVAYASEKRPSPRLEYLHDDICTFPYESADLMVSYYTIQFIHPKKRQELLNLIYSRLNWGGGFIFFEKVRAPDARFQDIMTALYTDYKMEQGYNAEEIVGKSRSLKGVLEPFSTEGNLNLLRRAGFQDIMTVFKHICFEGFLAIK